MALKSGVVVGRQRIVTLDHGHADTMQLSFIKRVLHLPPAADTLTVLAESGRLPMQIKLIESQARYWERLYSAGFFPHPTPGFY